MSPNDTAAATRSERHLSLVPPLPPERDLEDAFVELRLEIVAAYEDLLPEDA